MSEINSKSAIQESTISAIITRADGTVEDLGIISYYHNSPIKRMLWWLKQKGGLSNDCK